MQIQTEAPVLNCSIISFHSSIFFFSNLRVCVCQSNEGVPYNTAENDASQSGVGYYADAYQVREFRSLQA